MVKGIESERRNEAPVVRTIIRGVLTRSLLLRSPDAAVNFVKHQVIRLLRGDVDLGELTFTAALVRSCTRCLCT